MSKAENPEERNNEWWCTEAGYTAKSPGKQLPSHSSPHSPTWIMVQRPSVKMLNLVCPRRKHKTQVMHMLRLIFEDDLPVSSMGQALRNNRRSSPRYCVSRLTTTYRGNRLYSKSYFYTLPPGACFSLVGQRRGDALAAGFGSELV